MVEQGRYAQKGYSYQKDFYTLLVVKMDISKDIDCVEIEKIFSEAEKKINNFDDCYLELHSEKYYFQVKNIKNRKGNCVTLDDINVVDSKITINSNKILFDKNNINILIINTNKIHTNTKILGLDAINLKGIYIVPITSKEINKSIDDLYSDVNRVNEIKNFTSEKINNDIFKLNKIDLPPVRKLFPTKLDDETIILRADLLPELENGILMVVGKPGVGKSHFVNELDKNFQYDALYRFWIGSNDPFKKIRLTFDQFIKELNREVFNSHGIFTYEELVNEINEKELTVIIDGLDHVENYNFEEFDRYINFIEDCSNGKILVLSRPLKKVLKWEKIDLDNWTSSQTQQYLKEAHGIEKYEIIDNIFDVGNGYAIITKFLAEHYKLHGEIPDSNFTEINDYYDSLFEGNSFKANMLVFLLNEYFIREEELDLFLSEHERIVVLDFMKNTPYLFNRELNRISLIHDSLNTYLKQDNDYLQTFKKEKLGIVKESIDNFEINFLSRFDGFGFEENYIKEVLIRFADFESFEKLLNSTFDFESIQEFYRQLKNSLHIHQNLDVYQIYSFILIGLIVERNTLEGYYSLLYQIFTYMYKNSLDEKDIFSKGIFWKMYNYFRQYQNQETIIVNWDGISYPHDFYEKFNNEYSYWNNLTKDIEADYIDLIRSHESQYESKELLIELFTNIKFNERTNSKYYSLIDDYLNNGEKFILKDLENICLEFNISRSWIPSILNKLTYNLKSLGIIKTDNMFIENNLEELIEETAYEGSFHVQDHILKYFRLKNHNGGEIDLNSLNLFQGMYFERKDYSVITINEALWTFENKNLIKEYDSIDLISNLMDQSEKGIRHILTDYFNFKGSNFIKNFLKERDFPNQYINIFDLSPDLINECSINDIGESLMNIYDYNSYSGSIRYDEVSNGLKSKYKNSILDNISFNWYSLNNPEEDMIHNEYEYVPFNYGFIHLNDLEYIKENNLSCIEISKYCSHNFQSFCYLELYQHYPISDLRENFFDIIYTSMFINSFSAYAGWSCYLGNLPMFLDKIGCEVDWNKLFEIFNSFLRISLIKF